MKVITKKQLSVLHEVIEFLEAYVEYNIDVKLADDEPTDAQILSKQLPTLKSIFDNKEVKEVEESKPEEPKTILGYKEGSKVEDIIYTEKKKAEESVNPNYKYCVVESSLDSCYLTDDEVAAMEFAIKKSKNGKLYYVCEIRKVTDGTYKTFILGNAADGDYAELNRIYSEFLHYNYIASAASEVGKI